VSFAGDAVSHLLAESARIEREKCGLALTEDEARTLKATHFLRQIAPYLFEESGQKVAPVHRAETGQ
jgi:hypothetical protein